jgi:ABC-type transport system involved in multi-copper enzyme maturation permease subunit
MSLSFEPAVLQYLIVIVTSLAASTAVGLKRGWRGQLMAFVPILALWALLGTGKESLISAINGGYRGLLFFASCGSQTNAEACLEASGVANAVLVDPGNAEQVRLLLLLAFVSAVALVLTLVVRLGRPPTSLVQRLMGAVLGVANGFTLSYLLLPLLPYRQEINLPVASATQEGIPNIAGGLPSSLGFPHVSAAVVIVGLLVIFVLVAIRLMRRPAEV